MQFTNLYLYNTVLQINLIILDIRLGKTGVELE